MFGVEFWLVCLFAGLLKSEKRLKFIYINSEICWKENDDIEVNFG